MFSQHITHEEIEALPYVAFGGKITIVDKPEKVAAAVSCLMQEKILGYDTETRPTFTRGVYYGVSLVQLSSADHAFLFRIDKIGIPPTLVALLQDKQALKVGVAINEDIRGMQRVGAFKPQGFIDLQKFTEAYGIEDKALKKIAAIVLNLRISKSQQTSNWAAARYSAEQKLYAATDAWVCREIYLKLMESEPLIAPVPAEELAENATADSTKEKAKKHKKWHGKKQRRVSMIRQAQQPAGKLPKNNQHDSSK
ncbi:MAG: 3'-5' exonuclease domain-containing protein 2 [Prevotellaceae bacterium]|jgi:ribonuclease D|nr:3'-5' exonuclease domain-containing protein 2 [Prevotellaceae bacterium]